MKVCEKVQKKVVTSYNEVADELVAEFSSGDNNISPNEAVSSCSCHSLSVSETLVAHSAPVFGPPARV